MTHGGNVWRGGAPSDWLDFSANLRPEGPPEWVRQAMREGLECARYYPDPQMRAARAALAEALSLPPEWVLPTAGGISAIDMAAHLPSRSARTFSPCFDEYAQQLANCGRTVSDLPLLAENHALKSPCAALEGADIRDCALWLCNPLNPVGAAFSADEVEALIERVEAANGWLIVDEAFIHFCPERTARGLLRAHPRLVIVGSMTKALGIPGLRLGYIYAEPKLLTRLARYQRTWELNCAAEAVLCALPAHAEELRADREKNAARREALRRGLMELHAFVYPSEANFLLADFGRPVAPLIERLREKKILVRDCMSFHGIDDGRHLRLAVKDEAANARLLAEIKEAIQCVGNR